MILGVSLFAFGIVVVFALTRKVNSGKNLDAPPARSRSKIVITTKSKTCKRPLNCCKLVMGRAKLTAEHIKKRLN